MDKENNQFKTSFLLGLMYGGIMSIIESEEDMHSRLVALEDLGVQLRQEIEKLYYQIGRASCRERV